MKTIKKTILILTALCITACSKNEAPTTVVEKSSAKQLTAFTFRAADNTSLSTDVMATVNESTKTVDAVLPVATDLKALTPVIETSPVATIDRTGAQDFSNPVSYTITAEDGSSNVYSVLAAVEKSTEKQLLSFVFKANDNAALTADIIADIDEANKTITATVPNNTDVSALVPTMEVSVGAMVLPKNEKDFPNPLTYTVTAEDGSSVDYEVMITVEESDENRLLSMVFRALDSNDLTQDVTVTINENQKTGTATVPFGTDVTAMLPTTEVSEGASATPEERQDFSDSVTYKVTAENGDEETYNISVTIKPPSSSKQITQFRFLDSENSALFENITATIDESAKTILAFVPNSTNRNALVPKITASSKASVSPAGPQNFNNDKIVNYTVTAEDGSSVTYKVQVFEIP